MNSAGARPELGHRDLVSVTKLALRRFWQVLVATINALCAFIVDSCSRRRPVCEAPTVALLYHRPRLMQQTDQSWLPNLKEFREGNYLELPFWKNVPTNPITSSATEPSLSASRNVESIPNTPLDSPPPNVFCRPKAGACLLTEPITMVATTGSMRFKMSSPTPVCSAACLATCRLTSLLPSVVSLK